MPTKYRLWLKIAATFQLLTAAIHSVSFFVTTEPKNDSEKSLTDLMENYKMDLGAGFTPTTQDIMNFYSIAFVLLLLFGGLVNWYLLRKRAAPDLLKGIMGINVLIYGGCFVGTAMLTFLPPIICTGLIFIFLLITYLTIPGNAADTARVRTMVQ